MNILLVGAGGREHALAWKIAQSPLLTRLVCAPGNTGMAKLAETRPVSATDVDGLVALAQEISADLVVIGPESAVEVGLADRLEKLGIPCFGPSAAAGQLETSKAFTKAFCDRHGLPTAAYGVFEAPAPAKAFLDRFTAPFVIKADGLASGKGVTIAKTRAEAEAAIDDMLGGGFGAAGARVVIEEFLEGEEASYIVMSDGSHALPMASSQDHKRRDEGDLGPNTGGMGAYSPAPVVTPEIEQRILKEVIEPTLRGMAAEGAPFMGFLYAGLMIDKSGAPKVIEFNVRFGDPETQPIMLRLKSDLVELIDAALDGRLEYTQARWDARPAIGVVMAAGGYPGRVRSGDVIGGLDAALDPHVKIFHAGTRLDAEGRAVTAGGRVLTVCALGNDIAAAREHAYAAVSKIRYEGAFCRRDIAHRALRRS